MVLTAVRNLHRVLVLPAHHFVAVQAPRLHQPQPGQHVAPLSITLSRFRSVMPGIGAQLYKACTLS
jgi:hypothetical protein